MLFRNIGFVLHKKYPMYLIFIFLLLLIQERRNLLYQTVPIMIICGWVWSVFLALPPLLGWGEYRPEDSGMRYTMVKQSQDLRNNK